MIKLKKTLLLTLSFVVMMSIGAFANGIYGGISYNTYDLGDINDAATSVGVSEEDSGIGFYLGYERQIDNKTFTRFEFEHLGVEWDSVDNFKATSNGFMSVIGYNIAKGINSKINLLGGLGFYNSELESYGYSESDIGFGFKLGIESEYNLSDNTAFVSRINYRNNNVDVEGVDVDFSGLELAIGMNFKF